MNLKELKKYINENMVSKDKKSYVRNNVDEKMDISLIGTVIPFKVFTPKEKKVQKKIMIRSTILNKQELYKNGGET